MAANESVTLLERSYELLESIEKSINNCGNIKSSEKINIAKGVNGLSEIIAKQNGLIIAITSTSEENFKSFVTEQQNVNKQIFERLDELKNSLVNKQLYSTALKTGQQLLTDFRDKKSKMW